MLRRRFIHLLASGILFAALGVKSRRSVATSPYMFRHGVASGDPLSDGIIIWTRVSGASEESVAVSWRIATDASLRDVLQSGEVVTDADHDYTVKADVRGLPAGARLYYQFVVDGVPSPIGTSRTLPEGEVDAARFAVVSCSNYAAGYFHAYGEIAKRDDIDAVIHLGDYIYEYGLGGYATERAEQLERVPDPIGEVISLQDYRRRHAQYKSDPDSMAMHAKHPMIAVWDDHEISNDAWRKGAENHDDGEGRWSKRRDAAIQAYFEWMPIRGEARGKRTKIFRNFQYGNLLSLIMLDTRFYGRDRQPRIAPDMSAERVARILGDKRRRILGKRQERWLRAALARAKPTTWQLIGQQVLVSPVRTPDLEPLVDLDGASSASRDFLEYSVAMSKYNPPLLLDTWDGYAAAREDLLAELATLAKNPVFLSGDLHTSIAGNLVPRNRNTPVAVEFMTSSVSSPGISDYLPEYQPGATGEATMELNSDLRYLETMRRGWLCMSITKTSCTGEWHLIDTVHSREFSSYVDRRLSVTAGNMSKGLSEA